MQTVPPSSEPASSPAVTRLVQAAVQAERERIAKVLHATVCQDLTGTYLMASATLQQCRKLAPELAQKFDGLVERLQGANTSLTQVLRSLEAEAPDEKDGR